MQNRANVPIAQALWGSCFRMGEGYGGLGLASKTPTARWSLAAGAAVSRRRFHCGQRRPRVIGLRLGLSAVALPRRSEMLLHGTDDGVRNLRFFSSSYDAGLLLGWHGRFLQFHFSGQESHRPGNVTHGRR